MKQTAVELFFEKYELIKQMEAKQQTAVEWLEHELIKRGVIRRGFMIPDNIFKQAKEMEKEQIKKAFLKNHLQACWMNKTEEEIAEQYYNETYEK